MFGSRSGVPGLPRTSRMFEIIQLLRSAKAAVTAEAIAERLEVAKRTVYRDIAALQAMRVPIEGEAGVGYVMRPGFDLPPLMLTAEEVEAVVVGLAMLGRTGDAGLLAAARSAAQKIADVQPGDHTRSPAEWHLHASAWHAIPGASVEIGPLRHAIRDEQTLAIAYRDEAGAESERTVRPIAVIYYIEAVVLAAWCELRSDFRHFRLDRIARCKANGERFRGQGDHLRRQWLEHHRLP